MKFFKKMHEIFLREVMRKSYIKNMNLLRQLPVYQQGRGLIPDACLV